MPVDGRRQRGRLDSDDCFSLNCSPVGPYNAQQMSLITRCPACATMFKVVPDQLRVSDGWVRCGQCDEVFDANAHLQSPAEVESESVAPEDSSQLDWDGTLEEAAAPTSEIQLDFPDEVDRNSAHAVRPSAEDESVVSDVNPEAPLDRSEGVDSDPVALDPLDVIPGDDVKGLQATAEDVQPVLPFVESADKDLEGNGATPPGFLRKSHTGSRRSSRSTRVLGVTFCVLLVCSLGMQILVQERDRIVATESATLALLQPVCDVLGCRIAPLRQIESVAIDHSAFSKVQLDVYRFSFAIKSTALVAVAVPSLELTLTDLQDRPVIRRVFSPRELGAQVEVVAPGGEWSGSVPVEIKMPDGAPSIAGYRMLAFYP